MNEQRRLAATVSADVAGYSRLVGRDESGTLAALKAIRQAVVDPAIARHWGRIVKTTGEGLLLECASAVEAVRCVVEAPPSEAELAEVPKRLAMPCLANMVEGGRTPVLLFAQLEAMGCKVAIYPNSLTRLFARAGQDLLASLKSTGGTDAFANQMLDHGQLWSLFENERWQALEKRFQ
jgi:hypothetical protein